MILIFTVAVPVTRQVRSTNQMNSMTLMITYARTLYVNSKTVPHNRLSIAILKEEALINLHTESLIKNGTVKRCVICALRIGKM